MRTDQHIGLTQEAQKFLKDSVVIKKVEKVKHYFGMFGDEYPLYCYCLSNDCYADEYLQASPWYSGPMFFIGLKSSDGKIFEWTEAEIQGHLK